jgi:hypothetical protein
LYVNSKNEYGLDEKIDQDEPEDSGKENAFAHSARY